MHADAAFIVGHAHHDKAQACQDYALSGAGPTSAWALVADGCSTGRRTDLGARLWAHAGAALLAKSRLDTMEVFAHALGCPEAARALGVEFEDMLATLVVMQADVSRLRVMAFGDGCVVLKYKDGRVRAIEMTYELNGPRYLAYETLAGMTRRWETDVAGSQRTARHWVFDAQGELVSCEDEVCLATQGLGWDFSFDLLTEDLELALVTTDGASSIDSRAAKDWFLPLAAVRSCVGQFVQRRVAAMVRGWQKSGKKGPSDDLAVAGIWLAAEDTHG